jgi:hypothetical protein
MAWQEGRQCSIGPMRARIAWLAGAVGVAGAAAYRALRHKEEPSPGEDPRAEELRHKLDESRTMVEERQEFESAETSVDEVIGPEPEVEDRRKAVHERGRAAAEEMRGSPPGE